jgi:hypothetical protein
MDVDTDELVGFTETEEWDLLDEEFGDDPDFEIGEDDEIWTSS